MALPRLTRAVELFRSNLPTATTKIEVQWKPFQIDPDTALDGEEMEAYCRRRWGGSGWTRDLRRSSSRREPPPPQFANWKWWPHTGRAHQWVLYGMTRHSADSNRLNVVLFQALYEEGANVSCIETLVELGRKEFPDCDVEALADYLRNNRGHGQVQKEIVEGKRQYKIRAVPYFVMERVGSKQPPYGFSGAQPSSTFTEIFQKLVGQDDDDGG